MSGLLIQNKIVIVSKAVLLLACFCFPTIGVSGTSQKAGTMLAGERRTRTPTGAPIWAVQIDFTRPGNVGWDASDFAAIAHSGINRVEINLDWDDLEPKKGQYDFRRLDSYLAAADKADIKLIPIFWESVWGEEQGKNPPRWLTGRDLSSGRWKLPTVPMSAFVSAADAGMRGAPSLWARIRPRRPVPSVQRKSGRSIFAT
jgi:hypothetical protein